MSLMSHITFISQCCREGLYDLIFNFHCILWQSCIRYHYIKSNSIFQTRQYNIYKKEKINVIANYWMGQKCSELKQFPLCVVSNSILQTQL